MLFSLYSWPVQLSRSRTHPVVRLSTLHRSASTAVGFSWLSLQGTTMPLLILLLRHESQSAFLRPSLSRCLALTVTSGETTAIGRLARPTMSCRHSVLFDHPVNKLGLTKCNGYCRLSVSGCCAVQLISKQQCSTAEAQRVGRLAVLPILLSAVLPYAKLEGRALEDFLQGLAADGASGEASSMWAVQHIQVQPDSCSCTCLHPATGLAEPFIKSKLQIPWQITSIASLPEYVVVMLSALLASC